MSAQDNQGDADVIDLEEYVAAGRSIPRNKRYRIRIDKERYVVSVEQMTGRQILDLAGKKPEKFLLRQKTKSGVLPIEQDQIVSFVEPGVERFMTIPNEVTEGEPAPTRRQFTPLAADLEYLDGLGLRWETLFESGVRAVIIYNWPLPNGFQVGVADVQIRLGSGYPDEQIDMAHFSPALARADGRSINGLSNSVFDGRQWQQWSRHRTPSSQWRLGEDNLSTHMPLVRHWLEAETRKC